MLNQNLENNNDSNSENENMEFKPLEQVMQSKLTNYAQEEISNSED